MTTKNSFGKNDGKYFTYRDLLTTENLSKSLKTRLDFRDLATVLVVEQYLCELTLVSSLGSYLEDWDFANHSTFPFLRDRSNNFVLNRVV